MPRGSEREGRFVASGGEIIAPRPRRETRRRRLLRLRHRVRVRVALTMHVLRKLGPPALAVAAYTLVAAFVLRWDLARTRQLPDFQTTLYQLYTQLFMQSSDPFPPTPLARAIYWATPLAGGLLVVQGLLKVGASVFDAEARARLWADVVSNKLEAHVVVCGLGHVGYRVVQELRELGEDVVAIERHETESFVDVVRASGIPVHVGDARRDDLLVRAGVKNAKAVVCATSDDLANLEIALDSKRMNPSVRVVLRMFDQRVAAKVGEALEVDESFSASALAAPLVAMQATQEGVRSAYRLGEDLRVTAEAVVGEGAAKRWATVEGLEEKSGCRVVSRRAGEGGSFVTARSADRLRAGDVLVFDVAAADLPRLLALLRRPA
jgi:voltage-gated potassium channel